MRVLLAIAIVTSSVVAAEQSRGQLTAVTADNDVNVGTMRVVVTGRNPCSAVRLTFGDGNAVTHTIAQLPFTYSYEYTRVGNYAVRAEGIGNCDGVVTGRFRVAGVRQQPLVSDTQPPTGTGALRFSPMDRNGDGVIARTEWTGSAASFEFHDWNQDNRLAGNEVRIGAGWGSAAGRGRGRGNQVQPVDAFDWSDAQFRQLDRNGDNRLSASEWRYDLEHFVRVDRNRNGLLTLDEFLISDVDDDRGDRFVDLDLNRNGRLEYYEWHGSPEAFRWLDRNADGVLAQMEVTTGNSNAGGQVPQGGWQGADQPVASRTVVVSGRAGWMDTGIDVLAGDVLSVQATGTIGFSKNSSDVAVPDGARGRAATARAPMPNVFIGALIARIGTGAPFFVGAEPQGLRASHSGRLYLGVNDDVLNDNSGEFRARVTVERGPNR